MQTTPRHWHVGVVGYGEVGRILAEDLRTRGATVSAYDLKLDQPATEAPLQAHATQHGVQLREKSAAPPA
jgi:phosphoglycerate dehydrogenase-like enzyme